MMQHVLPGLLLFLSYIISVDLIINPGCECVVYQSYGLSQGTFKSPNHPAYYARGISCILFSFIGDRNEIVELEFKTFHLKPRNIHRSCTDYIKLFLDLESPEVSENTRHNTVLCGNYSDLMQTTYYSRGRSLILEFHSDSSYNSNFTGFSGTFKFLDSKEFTGSGEKKSGTMCSYEFISLHRNKRGRFFSPLFPQNYPPSRHCSYKFLGRKREIVKVVFQIISLYKRNTSTCDTSPDYIVVYNGEGSESEQIRFLCGTSYNKTIISTGPYLYIEFHSDEEYQQKGFAATYQFFPENMNFTTTTLPQNHPVSQLTNCNKSIDHTDSSNQNGVILSQNYRGPYPTSMTCVYDFQAAQGERVQIKFHEMNLYYSNGDGRNTTDCKGQDSINIYVGDESDPTLLGLYCGQRIPHQYMSYSQWLRVVFKSKLQYTDTSVTGFKFEYTFRTDYGILGYRDVNKNCSFLYSSSRASKGNFTSPNFPGIYPLHTKCIYTFQGAPGEKVLINFTHFDVGYARGCDDPKDSDYVTFSNFKKSIDKAMQKLCGKFRYTRLSEKSDAAFFRVIFHSKNNFARGTGFSANYLFQKDQTLTTTTIRQGRQSSHSSSTSASLLYVISVIWAIVIVHPKISLS